MKIKIHSLVTGLIWLTYIYHAAAQGTMFAYQGRLNDAGGPANGTNYGMVFYLYDAPTNGNLLGNEGIASVVASNGLFTVLLDFSNVFDGNPRWLEIAVQKNGGSFATLSPRQQIQPAPYAVFAHTAGNLSGTISPGQLSGPLSLAQLPRTVITNNESSVTLNGAFTGNGGALTNLQLSSTVPAGTFGLQSVPLYFNQATYDQGFPVSVTVADVNGDGKMDLISADDVNNVLLVLTNNGSGGFGPYVTIPMEYGSYFFEFVTTADINGDGRMDLIASDYNDDTVMVYTNNGSGGFGAYGGRYYSTDRALPSPGNGPVSVTAADVDGDGLGDLIVANRSGSVTVMKNYGSYLGFDHLSSYWGVSYAVGRNPSSVVAADINGDSLMDVITANAGDNTLTILTNNGTGFVDAALANEFGSNATLNVGASPRCVVAADVNGDGHVDLITANYGDNTLTILTNNGSGIFGSNATLNVGSGPVSLVAADINGDGHLDLACVNANDNTMTVLTNDGSGIFHLSATVTVGTTPNSIASGDFNGDGNADLVSASVADGTLSVLSAHTKDFSSDIESFFSANVGIGTTSPAFPLSLGGGDGNKIAIWDNGVNSAMGFGAEPGEFIFFLPDSNNRFSFLNSPNGAEITAIDGHGNIAASGNISAGGVFIGNGGGLTGLNYNNLTNPPVIPSTNGFVTAAVTDGLATTNFVTSRGYLTSANGGNAALATNVVSGISITNAFITNSVFAGNGSGLTNLNYDNLANPPVIPSTNGLVTAAVTNGLATTDFVTSRGYLTSATTTTAANYVFAYDTNSEAGYIFFQGAVFANVGPINGWTYSVVNDAEEFTCPQTGLYLIAYSGEATGNAGDTFSMAVIVSSGIAPGSQASVYFPTSSGSHPVSVSKNFIASLNAGQVLKLESSGTTPACHLAPDTSVSGSVTPSVSLTIVHLQ